MKYWLALITHRPSILRAYLWISPPSAGLPANLPSVFPCPCNGRHSFEQPSPSNMPLAAFSPTTIMPGFSVAHTTGNLPSVSRSHRPFLFHMHWDFTHWRWASRLDNCSLTCLLWLRLRTVHAWDEFLGPELYICIVYLINHPKGFWWLRHSLGQTRLRHGCALIHPDFWE